MKSSGATSEVIGVYSRDSFGWGGYGERGSFSVHEAVLDGPNQGFECFI